MEEYQDEPTSQKQSGRTVELFHTRRAGGIAQGSGVLSLRGGFRLEPQIFLRAPCRRPPRAAVL